MAQALLDPAADFPLGMEAAKKGGQPAHPFQSRGGGFGGFFAGRGSFQGGNQTLAVGEKGEMELVYRRQVTLFFKPPNQAGQAQFDG
jgi:hypothetical protein